MAPVSKSAPKKEPSAVALANGGVRKSSAGDITLGDENTKSRSPEEKPVVETLTKLSLSDYIYASLGGDTVGTLIGLSDVRDELIASSSAGFFPDVITGCMDVSMAVMEAQFKLADSLEESQGKEELIRENVRLFILSILDAVYGPNCVRIAVYNPDVDWNISLWQMFPVSDSPSSRNFLSLVPSQSDTIIQWLDLKSQLIKQCRNPKQEAQRKQKIIALEEELQDLALRHATLIERFIKIQQGEKDPEAAQARRDAMKQRLGVRKQKLTQLVLENHTQCVDPIMRTRRDAILWGGPPHVSVSASLNNSTVSAKAGSSLLLRRLSRFGFREEEDFSDQDSSPPDDLMDTNEKAAAPVGCLALFKRRPRCCL